LAGLTGLVRRNAVSHNRFAIKQRSGKRRAAGTGHQAALLASFRLNRISSHRHQTSLIDIICRCSTLAPCQPAWQPANLAQCSSQQPISAEQEWTGSLAGR